MFGNFKFDPSKLKNALSVVGGGLKDLDGSFGTSNLKGAQQEIERQKQMAQQKQLLAQATQGLSPQQAALAQINPQAFSQRQISNQFQDPLAVQAAQQAQQQQAFTQNRQTQNDQFSQTRATQNDTNALTQQGLDNQFRQDGRQIQQQQFGAQQEFRTNDALRQQGNADRVFAANQGQRAQDNDFRNQQFQENRFQKDRNFQASQTPDPIALAKEQRAATEFQQEQDDRTAAASTADAQRGGVLDQIKRLRGEGELSGGFNALFGGDRIFNPASRLPGSNRNDANGVLEQIVSNLTLDKIANFKGAISDKDLEIAQGAATRLQKRNISDSEAKKALDELFTAFGGQAPASDDNFSNLSDDDLLKIINGG